MIKCDEGTLNGRGPHTQLLDISPHLGLDEWPTIGKIAWWGAMLGTGMLGWWRVHQVYCAAFRRAFVLLNAQARQ